VALEMLSDQKNQIFIILA